MSDWRDIIIAVGRNRSKRLTEKCGVAQYPSETLDEAVMATDAARDEVAKVDAVERVLVEWERTHETHAYRERYLARVPT